jgi:hypothetical protein
MLNNMDFNKVMKSAGERINFAKRTLMGRGGSIRDEKGFSFTADRLLTGLSNLLDSGSSTKFAINEAILNGMANAGKHNFSASDMKAVEDVNVIDIALGATVASHGLTYIAMERSMDSVAQQITFQGLKAVNSVAGFTAGAKVMDPRSALSTVIDISRNGAKSKVTGVGPDSGAISIALDPAGPIVKGETKIYIVETDDIATATPTLIAFDAGLADADASGVVELVMTKGALIDDPKINLNTGAFTATAAADLSDYTLIVEVCHDRIAESDGANTLKLKPFMDSKKIEATENRVILQSAIEVQAQMNKILRKNAQYGVNADFGKRAIDQVVQLYTHFIDVNIVRKLWEGVSTTTIEETIDLSGFSTSSYTSFASTKNDRLSLFTDSLCSKFLARTGSPVTALIVDEAAALMYASDKESFIPEPAYLQRNNGLIGTYKNLPVVRQRYLNGKGSAATNGVVIGVFKSVDGNAAPVAFGDYLTPYSTLPAVNANNPGELSQALFSQTACESVVPEWSIRGEIIPYTPSSPSSSD